MEEPKPAPTVQELQIRSTPRRDLRVELSVLQKQLKECARNCLKRLDTGLTQAIESTKGDSGEKVTQETARLILQELRTLNLKPAKGRRKDLKSIEQFIERAFEILRKPGE